MLFPMLRYYPSTVSPPRGLMYPSNQTVGKNKLFVPFNDKVVLHNIHEMYNTQAMRVASQPSFVPMMTSPSGKFQLLKSDLGPG